jgi:hypothetical protein
VGVPEPPELSEPPEVDGSVVLVATVGLSSPPPIIIAATLDEPHTTKRPTPAAIAAIVFYYYTVGFFTDMIGVSTYQ